MSKRTTAVTRRHARDRHGLHGDDWREQHAADHAPGVLGGWAHQHADDELREVESCPAGE